ncbi:hypothetical protein TrRE_jg9 [Triparma retinervis]|uniref:Uncharacterized protein n=1 Tax=Triparma retinervis TaxID=2557542 RepID=A0A9W7E2P9_9STRA|nr:hypothetical protein TrRE_jg9 [Triparma retinervis]
MSKLSPVGTTFQKGLQFFYPDSAGGMSGRSSGGMSGRSSGGMSGRSSGGTSGRSPGSRRRSPGSASSSRNRKAFILYGIGNDEKNKKDHDELEKTLKERGAVHGMIEQSIGNDVKRIKLAGVIMETPEKVLDYFFNDTKEEEVTDFRRHFIDTFHSEGDDGKERLHVVTFVQCLSKGGRMVVEFLLDLDLPASSDDQDAFMVRIQPAEEDDLVEEAVLRLDKAMVSSSKGKTVHRGR